MKDRRRAGILAVLVLLAAACSSAAPPQAFAPSTSKEVSPAVGPAMEPAPSDLAPSTSVEVSPALGAAMEPAPSDLASVPNPPAAGQPTGPEAPALDTIPSQAPPLGPATETPSGARDTALTPAGTPVPAVAPAPPSVPVPTPAPRPAAPPSLAPAPQGRSVGTLRVAGLASIPHRDVHQSVQEMLTSLGPGLAYSRLLRLHPGPEAEQPSLRLECDLCQSWEITPELAYRFSLRPGVRWQDIPPVSGRPLTAEDLVFSYKRMGKPGWPNGGLLAVFESIEAPDKGTLVVKLASPDADALLALADGHSKIVAREVVERYGDLKASPVIGTGPWVWEEPGDGEAMTLLKNQTYFEEAVPFLDRLVVQVIQQSGLDRSGHQERLAAFLAGLVDVVLAPPGVWRELQTRGGVFGSVVSRQPGTGVVLALNVRSPTLASLEVRKAIFRAIDPWDYVDAVFQGQGYAGVGIPVASPDWLLDREEVRRQHFADPSQARNLLAAWAGDRPVDIELTVRTEAFEVVYGQLADRVAHDLRGVGFNPRVRRLNPAQFSEALAGPNKDYQVALGVLPPTSTTNSFLFALLHSAGRWNLSGHRDSKLDGMIERQAVEFDLVRRRAQIQEVQRHILDQAYLFSPAGGASRWVFQPAVRGFYPNTALSEYHYWSQVWLAR